MRTDSQSPVSGWQPIRESEVTFMVKNTFVHLEQGPSPSARPARRCGTSPAALLAAALESCGPGGKGDGDGSWAHPWEGESSDGGVPEGCTPGYHGDVDSEAESDEAEMRVTIKNTFLHLEPVEPVLFLRTHRRFKTTPDCSDRLEDEESASTRAPSCERTDAVSVYTAGEETSRPLEKKKKAGGLRDSHGSRPGKKARERYQALVASLQDMVRQDPSLHPESLPLPQYVLDNEVLKFKLVARVEAARPVVWSSSEL
jgi:hypothetical protein